MKSTRIYLECGDIQPNPKNLGKKPRLQRALHFAQQAASLCFVASREPFMGCSATYSPHERTGI